MSKEKKQDKVISDLENKLISAQLDELINQRHSSHEISYLVYHLAEKEGHHLQQYANCFHQKLPQRSISLWITKKNRKYIVLSRISEDLAAQGFQAQELLKAILAPYGGRWGGAKLSAQGSASSLPATEELYQTLWQWISTQLT